MNEAIKGYGMYIKKISDLLSKEANHNLQAHNLTVSQFHMLSMIHRGGQESYTLKELESLFHVAQSTMAGLVSRLEAKGLLEPLTDPADKRIKRTRLTPEGQAVCTAGRLDILRTENRLTSGLSEGEKAQLLALLQRVYETLSSSDQRKDEPTPC